MRISSITIFSLDVSKKRPVQLSVGVIREINNVFVKLHTKEGLVGWGEASPFPPITGDNQSGNISTAKRLGEFIKGKDPRELDAHMKEMRTFTVGDASILSAFDMALHDLAAKAADVPLYRYLGGSKRRLKTDRTISLCASLEESMEKAKELKAAGLSEIKVKTGRSGLQDVRHLSAVREIVGDGVSITIDSNGGWDFPTAVANIVAMEKLNIQYSEQPLPAWDVYGLAELRRKVQLPICADESVFDDKDALRVIIANAVDYINIKLGKSGGIRTALRINAICEAAGKACMIGCFAESRLGLTAAAHVAMARANIRFLDLDSARGLSIDPIVGGATFNYDSGGEITCDDTPGLGCRVDETVVSTVLSI